MSRAQVIILIAVTFWSISMWCMVYIKASTPTPANMELSEEFKQWEAQSRLLLIDNVIDNPELIEAREDWVDYSAKLESLARMVMTIQNNA